MCARVDAVPDFLGKWGKHADKVLRIEQDGQIVWDWMHCILVRVCVCGCGCGWVDERGFVDG